MNRIPYNEFENDLEYQPSMDSAWHSWCQEKYRKLKEMWEKKIQSFPITEVERRRSLKDIENLIRSKVIQYLRQKGNGDSVRTYAC